MDGHDTGDPRESTAGHRISGNVYRAYINIFFPFINTLTLEAILVKKAI
jgi:hypothetical protein